jgi:TolB-like protein
VRPGDDALVRRIAAVLVAEHASAATGAAAEGGPVARAVALLRAGGGDAHRLAADMVVGGFDHAAAAVAAAGSLHASAGHAWRVGLHVAEVIMRAEADETRAAIERATALCRLARPGTTAVPADAARTLGRVHHATIETLESPPGTDPVCLIVPLPGGPSVPRRRLLALLAGTALGGAGAVAWFTFTGRGLWTDDDRRQVTLGVGPFRSPRADPRHAWISEAIRTGLNTQLSQLSGVKVYSQSFLDFLMTRERLSELEVASRLGIEKMLVGSVLVVGDSVRVEAQVVDVATGVLEGASAAVGREEDFLALENELLMGVITKLHVRMSDDDERRLAARRTVDPDALRRFLDTEGAGAAPAAPPQPPRRDEPSSRRWPWLGPRAAWADEARAAIMALVEDYRRALEARDVAALGTMYETFLPEQRALLERYFASVRDLKVRLLDVDVAVVGDEAVVSFTRVDDFVDVPTRRPQHLSVRVTRTLRRADGTWRFARGR